MLSSLHRSRPAFPTCPPRLSLLLFPLLLTGLPLPAQSQDSLTLLEERQSQLIDLLYDISDFQTRYGQALDNNRDFVELTTDAYVIEELTAESGRSALAVYSTAAWESISALQPGAVDSLLTILQSPYGPLIKRAFQLDNAIVENALAGYVNDLTNYGQQVAYRRDSLLFVKEFPYDLSRLLPGRYLEASSPTSGSQADTQSLPATVSWQTGNQYLLTRQDKSGTAAGNAIVATLYRIEGNSYYFIHRRPEGDFERRVLERQSYDSYDQEVRVHQYALQDNYFDPLTSPLPDQSIDSFRMAGGHQFYPVDQEYHITAKFTPTTSGDRNVVMSTSSAKTTTYLDYGTATFTLGGKTHRLTLYEPTGERAGGTLFLPFTDATSGTDSYGGGRYIEVDRPSEGQVTIDFNKAYNPYCAYTDGYSCPIPPAANHLSVAIEAGVRKSE